MPLLRGYKTTAALFFLTIGAAVVAGFLVTRSLAPVGQAEAVGGSGDRPIPQCMTSVSPSGVERTTCFQDEPPSPHWYEPLMEAEAQKPWFDGTLQGIRIGPDVDATDSFCQSIGERVAVPFDEAQLSALHIAPQYLPVGSEQTRNYASQCGGTVDTVELEYYVPPDLSIPRWGGAVQISRHRGEKVVGLGGFAADRAEAIEVSGLPAVLFHPVTADGFGPSAVVIAENFGVTLVVATGLPASDIIKIAESLY